MNISRFIDTNNRVKTFDPWVSNLIDNLFYDGSGRSLSKFPAVNVSESAEGFHVEFAVPGFSKEDFKISVEKDVLAVSGEHKAESLDEAKQYSRKEFSYSSFKRSFTLPESVDVNKIEANFKDGVLTLTVAKKEEVKPVVKEISVK
ncbi:MULTISPECIES: Hsp20/alpha crystallin family protein [Olivibacter]|jgi:HSP20 family protein|uniref:Hsp20/alpha crystallin family protein n=2 Tax=Olivibacter TaxID=376469 RepID=A0ABV6HRN9_9SPHI|nr:MULTISPECIES: Hsp20/alpha crystallin family protein [Olivibacter]MCL4637609.1 Hsp20/alpha crystallin family protein [Olivibacter sp. UJ_SKK_5.1]MDM8173971.1 Hsp20/alpha crystallin family protein [Olivibacter sp. 47]MDX3917048.1 Hsp20/alpha crystallin family protein [Pseudosphingobacterium sp.]QEL03756.1 Hsp20/alpha crystallin family protein [Olivibacter sp. LS-1]